MRSSWGLNVNRGRTILVVGTSAERRIRCATWLGQAGHDYTELDSFEAAFAHVATERPALVICDVDPADPAALAACYRLKASSSGTLLLQISPILPSIGALDAPIDAILVDPIDAAEMITLVRSLLRLQQIEADLRRACMRDDFNVVYQPITDTASGQVTGAEALLRWTCAERGEVSPAEFIPVAEDLGLVARIGAGVLKQACLDAAQWPAHLNLSVNISPVQLFDPRLPQTVAQALGEAGLDPQRLELEITETALLENDEIAMASPKR